MHFDAISLPCLPLILSLTLTSFASSSSSLLDSFIYAGCSPQKYTPESAYAAAVNSILSSFVNSATFTNYNSFNNSLQGSSKNDIVYGLYQCRGDLSNSACHDCVASAVRRITTTCGGAYGGAVQLEGCYVRYDNVKFLGVDDKTVVSDKCGPSIGDSQDLPGGIDSALAELTAVGQYFRVAAGGGGRVQGVAQCVQDLSIGECQDCLSDAVQRLRSQCGSAAWGDIFLAKCYARYSEREYHAAPTTDTGTNNNEVERSLAILIGLIAAVAVLVVFLSFFSKLVDRRAHGGGK